MIATVRSEARFHHVVASLVNNKGYTAKLEAELSGYFGVRSTLLTHTGRSALYYLLKALPQQKVYLPAFNCWAVAEAVLCAKKEPVYVDIVLNDFNMDIVSLRQCVEPDSIIVATHQFGIPCDMNAILELAVERNCFVIEDNAAAFGSEIDGRKTGSLAGAGILSFDYAKTLVSGKGGAILCNDNKLLATVRDLQARETRPPGFIKSLQFMLAAMVYSYATHKFAYPLTYSLYEKIRGCYRSPGKCNLVNNESYLLGYDDMRAKLAYRNLQRVDAIIARRVEIAERYMTDAALGEVVDLPVVADNLKAVMIKLPFIPREADRQTIYQRCKRKRVDLGGLFPYHYADRRSEPSNSRIAAEQGMALPVYKALSDGDVKIIIDSIVRATADGFGRQAQDSVAYVEKRRFTLFDLYYYWLDTQTYLDSRNHICLLRTHNDLPDSEYQLKFCYKTFLIDLSKTQDDIYADFDASAARYKIRKAQRSGVDVRRAVTADEKLRFYNFYREFVNDPIRKNKILVLQKNELDRLHIFYALSAEDEFLGGIGLLPSPDGEILLYKYAATQHRYCENELMLWRAICYAKDAGYRFFDMSWMLIPEDRDSDMYRLFQFKKKFGGELVDFYTYVKFTGPLSLLAKPFDLVLKKFFNDDINSFALFLKKLKIFK